MRHPRQAPLKILHVIPSLSAVHGGPSGALAMMEVALLAHGHDVETCATDDDGPGRRNGKPAGQALAENGVIRRYFRKHTEFYKVSIGCAWWLLNHARHYDIVHIHALFSFTSAAAAWAARRAGVPYVIRPLGTLNRYGIEQRRPALKRLSTRLIEGPLLARAAAVHFTSVQEQEEARALGVDMRGAVVPLGVHAAARADPELIRARFPVLRDSSCLLFLSRLDPKKNVESLLMALVTCKDAFPRLVILIAGDGAPEYVGKLKSLAERIGVAEHVVWAGHLKGEQKASAFAAAKAFVLPSFSENFGIAAVEALAAGLPCILGRGVAIACDVEKAGAGLAVEPTAEAIALAISQVMLDSARCLTMAGKAVQLAHDQYSVDAVGRNLSKMYAEILNHG